MKTALVHDWLVTLAGAEKVLESLLKLYPGPIHTLVQDPEKLRGSVFENQSIHSSLIQKLPKAKKKYRSYLPLFPLAIEQMDVTEADLVISSSHAVAKGVLTHADQTHICYCHTPMRYAWDLHHQYLRESGLHKGVKGFLAKSILHYMRLWDAQSAQRVDHFVANSHYVAKRIQKIYRREAEVVYPPVDVDFFKLEESKENFYLIASRMVPYKKIDLIVEAFGRMPDKHLVVIGDGPEMDKIKGKAKKNVEIMGFQSDDILRRSMQRAKALVFAALEDFGILPVEVQSCGTPVIALGQGGTLETVLDGKTGCFFREQTVESIVEAVERFERKGVEFSPREIREHAETFSRDRFEKEFAALVKRKLRDQEEQPWSLPKSGAELGFPKTVLHS